MQRQRLRGARIDMVFHEPMTSRRPRSGGRRKNRRSWRRHEANARVSTQEVLVGLVERVIFHDAENGFCVLRAKARGHRNLVTVIGHAAIISAGEWITASGEWTNDRTHGQDLWRRLRPSHDREPVSVGPNIRGGPTGVEMAAAANQAR
jgi:hypothetical protein